MDEAYDAFFFGHFLTHGGRRLRRTAWRLGVTVPSSAASRKKKHWGIMYYTNTRPAPRGYAVTYEHLEDLQRRLDRSCQLFK